MNFEEYTLDASICEALHILGYHSVLPVQEAVIPVLLQKKHLLVKSRTGSGKTASFAIPIIQDLIWEERSPQALVLSPTRELALQIKNEFDNIGAYKRIKTAAVFGKQPFRFQAQDLKQRCHVVIGTPGRILDHLEQGTLVTQQIRYIIIDEADEMLDMGFIDTIRSIFSYLPTQASVCMFSATLPKSIQELAHDFQRDPVFVEIQEPASVSEQIVQYAYRVQEHKKTELLVKLLCRERPKSCIIFARTKETVHQIWELLHDKGISIGQLHGDMMQEDRLETMKSFRLGKLRMMVATDVAARGIDVQDVTHIINYDMPNKKETYVHRIGRSARLDRSGTAISFLSHADEHRLKEIEAYMNSSLTIHETSELESVITDEAAIRTLGTPTMQKEEKGKELRKDTMKLYIGGGKSKKIRPGDIVGAICEIEGIDGDDIGVIQIQDHQSFVDILHGKGELVLRALSKKTIKGKICRVERAKQTT